MTSVCVDSPYSLNAVSAERFGPYRNIGAAVKFKCKHNYEMNGKPYSQCLPSMQWENWFSCVEKRKIIMLCVEKDNTVMLYVKKVTFVIKLFSKKIFEIRLLSLYNETINTENLKKCSDGWTFVSDKCYLFVYEKVDWRQAVINCKEYNGHLVKVANEFENTWLISQLTDVAWIGLNDITNEGQWNWISDGSGLNYTNWLLGEPNGFEIENCVNYCKEYCGKTVYGWNDEGCHSLQGYICERYFD
ncbi:CD206 [Mytilus edulis]|uniref:MRC n=1 Tax=Mytilus edulis TaxID=6550 RepID=A0A8S3V4H9_MYTED|nr:CD206 [Mytilus edulis]